MYPFQNNGKRVSSTWVNPEMPEAVEATFWWLKGSRAFSKFWLNSKPLQAFWVKNNLWLNTIQTYPDHRLASSNPQSRDGQKLDPHSHLLVCFKSFSPSLAVGLSPNLYPTKNLGNVQETRRAASRKKGLGIRRHSKRNTSPPPMSKPATLW